MFFDLVVQIHNMQNIKKLTFVLMETFYLTSKIERGSTSIPLCSFNIFCKTYFCFSYLICINSRSGLFASANGLSFSICDRSVIHPFPILSVIQSARSGFPCARNLLCVMPFVLLLKFSSHHLIEITELLCFQDICMQLRNAVYRKSRDNSHICHANLTVS